MLLTEKAIRAAKRPTSGQEILWDDLVEGFGIRLTPTRAAYIVQWREASGRRPREGLRKFWPKTTPEEARALARARLSEVTTFTEGASGIATRVAVRKWYERQTETADWTVRYRQKVDGLIRHFVEGEESERIKLTPATRAAIAKLGEKPVGEVKRSDVVAVADGIKRGAADQFMAVLSKFFNDSFDRGVEIPNPAKLRFRVVGARRVRTHTLTDAELVTLWRALEAEGDPALGAFAMLAYTGARRREVAHMRWSEVDLDAATWTLPPERRKTGKRDPEPFTIYLAPPALAVLKRQPVLTGTPFVFWGRRDERPFDFHTALMARLRALDVRPWRIHDVRRYVRSGMARLGISQVVAELCLGHKGAKGGLVGVYDQHAYIAEKRDAWAKWAEYLSRLTNEKP
jgi:integrase